MCGCQNRHKKDTLNFRHNELLTENLEQLEQLFENKFGSFPTSLDRYLQSIFEKEYVENSSTFVEHLKALDQSEIQPFLKRLATLGVENVQHLNYKQVIAIINDFIRFPEMGKIHYLLELWKAVLERENFLRHQGNTN